MRRCPLDSVHAHDDGATQLDHRASIDRSWGVFASRRGFVSHRPTVSRAKSEFLQHAEEILEDKGVQHMTRESLAKALNGLHSSITVPLTPQRSSQLQFAQFAVLAPPPPT